MAKMPLGNNPANSAGTLVRNVANRAQAQKSQDIPVSADMAKALGIPSNAKPKPGLSETGKNLRRMNTPGSAARPQVQGDLTNKERNYPTRGTDNSIPGVRRTVQNTDPFPSMDKSASRPKWSK